MSGALGSLPLGVEDSPPAGVAGVPTVIAGAGFGQNPATFPLPVTDLSARVKTFVVKRGRQRELDRTETGVLTATMRNHDRALDPAFAASPYYPNVLPVTPYYLQVLQNGVVYSLFRGDVEEWPQKWEGRSNDVEINVLDGFDALNTADCTTDRPLELSGARIDALLDAAEWPVSMRLIDTGQSLLQATTYTDANALTSLQDVATSERGNIFINADGFFVFHDRHRRWKAPYTTVQVTLSNDPTVPELPLASASVNFDRDKILNDVTLTQAGGGAYVSFDTTSKSRYRKRSYSATVINSDPNEIQAQADYLLQTYKDPLVRVDDIVIEPQQDANLWAHALGREIGDRITVEIFPPGGGAAIVVDCVIEFIQHTFVVGRWTTLWKVSRADTASYWVLGTSLLGVDTKLGY